jgi:CRISPR system Cascade subunit CasC
VSRTILELHLLQTVPPSNLNRDDTGKPKSAVYGGVPRARVSSQSWKRASRLAFDDLLDPSELGTRTKRVSEFVGYRIRQLDPSISESDALQLAAETVRAATGVKVEVPHRKKNQEAEAAPESSYLLFLSAGQRDGLARLAVKAHPDAKKFFKDKDNKAEAKAIANSRHSVDIALFGRMVADSSDINVDAAAQVAHAISVHRVENESDYYTAVDDRKRRKDDDEEGRREEDDLGAGMIGTIEFNSATLYRYAALDVDLLHRNLGTGLREDEPATTPVRRAVEAFVEGFITSLPTGKINTFGNHTLPDAAIVKVRTSRPISFVSAFEEPTQEETGTGHMRQACEKLAAYIPEIEQAYGVQDDARTWILRAGASTEALAGLGTSVSLQELVSAAGEAVANRQEPEA